MSEIQIDGFTVEIERVPGELFQYTIYNSKGEIQFSFKANWKLGRKQLMHYYKTRCVEHFEED